MNIKVSTYNTLPNKKDHWWQIVLFPTISIMNNIQEFDPYVAINIEWLFWSVSSIIKYGKQQEEPTPYFKG